MLPPLRCEGISIRVTPFQEKERGVIGELTLLVVQQGVYDPSHRFLGGKFGGEVSPE